MALTVVSGKVNVTISSVVAAVASVITKSSEASDHSINGRTVTARIDVTEDSVPVEAFAMIRSAIEQVRNIQHTLGPIRWVCRPGSRVATLELDLVSTVLDHDEEDALVPRQGEQRRSLKHIRSEESDEGDRAPAKEGALAIITDQPMRIRRWIAESMTALDRIVKDVDPDLLQSLDACRIPRVRMECIQKASRAFQSGVSAATRAQDRFYVSYEPLERELTSACTCLDVKLSGRLTVIVRTLEDSLDVVRSAASLFYEPHVSLQADGIRMRLRAATPECPRHALPK